MAPADIPPTSPTLSVAATAERLDVSTKTIRRRIEAGEISATLVRGPHGPEYRIAAWSVERARFPPDFADRTMAAVPGASLDGREAVEAFGRLSIRTPRGASAIGGAARVREALANPHLYSVHHG